MKKYILLCILVFFSSIAIGQNISNAEYFFNTDPGIGNGNALSVNANTGTLTQTFSIPTNTLPEGFHSLYVRTQLSSGSWSMYDKQLFYLKNVITGNIAAAEYFFNTDPGVGNGTVLSVDSNSGVLNQVFNIPTGSLPEGFHSFYLRTQDTNGTWSLYDRQIIYIKEFDFSLHQVTNAEYFIDTDPGVGNGTQVAFGDASQNTQALNINTTGLAEGEHVFYVRVQDTNGDWSIYDTALFNIDNSLSTETSLLKNISLYPSPFKNHVNINVPSNTNIKAIKIYNTLGKTVFSTIKNTKTLELHQLKSGMYILNLQTNVGNASFKIIKK
ncbi:T9SS type A sorting domain-containing protein [Seonamhaeicola algicola]|uniref:T9SS type A sorting domain-containing protein n=1 Tax=Seonamhaeicola algicola TaxID=1719036 RepID=A0A5C7B4I6_9FLAO|nr:T9SS type A sorting domain-containing protein [Seonamhaeicola algicola]TXE12792.1 T9SS type A sorting domain-containing protein [Seonamhaeicola algicola]